MCPNNISPSLSLFFNIGDDLSCLLAGREGGRLSVYHPHTFWAEGCPRQNLTSGARTKVCMNLLMGCMLLESSPITCTTTPSLSVACASTCRIFVWQSWNLSAMTFLWISCLRTRRRGVSKTQHVHQQKLHCFAVCEEGFMDLFPAVSFGTGYIVWAMTEQHWVTQPHHTQTIKSFLTLHTTITPTTV